jgi:hypothetical protein
MEPITMSELNEKLNNFVALVNNDFERQVNQFMNRCNELDASVATNSKEMREAYRHYLNKHTETTLQSERLRAVVHLIAASGHTISVSDALDTVADIEMRLQNRQEMK